MNNRPGTTGGEGEGEGVLAPSFPMCKRTYRLSLNTRHAEHPAAPEYRHALCPSSVRDEDKKRAVCEGIIFVDQTEAYAIFIREN